MNTCCWKLTHCSGSFATSEVSGNCQLLRPAEGVAISRISGEPVSHLRVLGVSLPSVSDASAGDFIEAFARSSDLVAIYAPTTDHPFRSQAYWRLQSHERVADGYPVLATIEAVASKQTDLLDSQPELTATSCIPFASAWHLQDQSDGRFAEIDLTSPQRFDKSVSVGCFVFRSVAGSCSYAEMVHPKDFEKTEISLAVSQHRTVAETCHHLFAHRLEKGVILRARVLGLFLPPENDLQAAAAHYAAFAASDPPLTA